MRLPRSLSQISLDHFLTGSTTTLNSPPEGSNLQDNLSPTLRSNVDIINPGTVARNDPDTLLANVKVVSVPDILSPLTTMDRMVYVVTYHKTTKYIYPVASIGNRIGNKVITVTVNNPRQLRALAILSSGIGSIKPIREGKWMVKSQHSDHFYTIRQSYKGVWSCECPNWKEYHHDCKHIYAVQFSKQLRMQVERDVKTDNILEVNRIIDCPSCKGYDVVKNGSRKRIKRITQRYLCKSCGHRFVDERELSRLKATPEVISVSMDLYFKGNSFAKVKHHLKMFYNLEVSRPTIMRWVHKFSTILNEYADKNKPDVGDLWNSDEMTVKLRETTGKNNNEWIWNLMDSSTRFLLASTITKNREVKDATMVLKQGQERAGKKPSALITDGLQSYIDANRKVFYENKNRTIHYRTPSKRKHFLNQNIERLNGTIRERTKVMRGMQRQETAQKIIDGERFYYNFVRPHMSLDGMTPAQIAGLPMPSYNPWLIFIREAMK